MKLLWATRGRTWGFRFLRGEGYPDPLVEHEKVFVGEDDAPTLCRRVGDTVGLRFPDPEGRKDAAGRVIPHEFVVFPPLADQIGSVEDGIEQVWNLPEVSGRYAEIWDGPRPTA